MHIGNGGVRKIEPAHSGMPQVVKNEKTFIKVYHYQSHQHLQRSFNKKKKVAIS